jgi:predicted NBD/HSP70 family sugar kinase
MLVELANRLLIDGDELFRNRTSLSRYYQQLKRSPSSVAAATKDLGMSRVADPVRALVTGDHKERPALAFGPSAGLVLGVSIGSASIRAALVDANGQMHREVTGPSVTGQLAARPAELFDRIKQVSEQVLRPALGDEHLLVRGALPFLGIAVAWPAPLDLEKVPRGAALSHHEWRSNDYGIHHRLAKHLHMQHRERSHALNDAEAATLAVAFDYTRSPEYRHEADPQPMIVVRISGGLGASAIVVEPIQDGKASGWMKSRVTGGHRGLAGEIGHTPVNHTLLRDLASTRPKNCPAPKLVVCSCAESGQRPDHVEAYAAGPALVARFARSRKHDPPEVLARILGDPENEKHRRVLEETGTLVGDCLLPTVLMLNPYRIVLTGRLATPIVKEAIETHLESSEALGRIFGGTPEVRILAEEENDYIRVRGAALAVLRAQVHRHLDELYGAPSAALPERFAELTEPITSFPWPS